MAAPIPVTTFSAVVSVGHLAAVDGRTGAAQQGQAE